MLGVDIAWNLVAAGNARAVEAGLDRLSFEEGDASDLAGLDDGRFDLVLSMFGAMFAPRPFDVAREMVAGAAPANQRVLGNSIHRQYPPGRSIPGLSDAFTPTPPEGFVSPVAGESRTMPAALRRRRAAPGNIAFEQPGGAFEGDIPGATPAAAKRSRTLSSTPQVTGLTKPSGGGGVKAALILRICATRVGSPGIQLPMTIRPPGRVDPHHLPGDVEGARGEHRSEHGEDEVEAAVGEAGEVGGVAFLEAQVVEAGRGGAGIAGGDQVRGDVDSEHLRRRRGRREARWCRRRSRDRAFPGLR